MRLKALMTVGMLMALPVMGQGTLNFATTGSAVGGAGAKVVDAALPNGVTGANYFAQLYYSTTENGTYTAIPLSITGFRTGAAAGFVVAKQVAVPGQLPGTSAWIQMRAWEGAAGSSYESTLGSGKTGISNNILVNNLGGTPAGGLPLTDPNLTGLTGFSIAVVPEPSTIALGLLGAAGLFLRRRK